MKTETYQSEERSSTAARPRAGEGSYAGKPQMSEEQMMKKMEAAGTPGPAHQALNALAGNWNAEVKCWSEPGGQPKVNHATSTYGWVLKGRFLSEEFQGEFMGKLFNGRCLIGYDNTKQKFNSVWIDDMHTSMCFTEGKGDNGNKVITLEGKMDCPVSGQKDITVTQVVRILSPDKHVLEMYNGDRKSMEITYTRQ